MSAYMVKKGVNTGWASCWDGLKCWLFLVVAPKQRSRLAMSFMLTTFKSDLKIPFPIDSGKFDLVNTGQHCTQLAAPCLDALEKTGFFSVGLAHGK